MEDLSGENTEQNLDTVRNNEPGSAKALQRFNEQSDANEEQIGENDDPEGDGKEEARAIEALGLSEAEGEVEAEAAYSEESDNENGEDGIDISYREAFNFCDTNKEGFIAKEKLIPCLEMLNLVLTPTELEILLDDVLPDSDSQIDFETFKEIMRVAKTSRDPENEILNAFKSFDQESRGYITTEELKLVLSSFDSSVTPAEAQEILKFVISKDGKFYYETFVKTLKDMGLLDEL